MDDHRLAVQGQMHVGFDEFDPEADNVPESGEVELTAICLFDSDPDSCISELIKDEQIDAGLGESIRFLNSVIDPRLDGDDRFDAVSVLLDFILLDLFGDDVLEELIPADLTDADLSGADLTRADLTGADLTRADLTGADLTGADLTGAIVTQEQLEKAESLSGAQLP